MIKARILIYHNISPTAQKERFLLDQLRGRLQSEGAEVLSFPESAAGKDLRTFLQQALPSCLSNSMPRGGFMVFYVLSLQSARPMKFPLIGLLCQLLMG
jgi:hypothetical protein